MTIAAARMLADGCVCFVGIGLPSAACNLARLTHAPDIVLIYESGTIGTRPEVLPLSIGDGELAETASFVVPLPEVFSYYLQAGRVDVGFLGAAQIDRFGNLNSTVIGPYDSPQTRLPGAGGAPEIAAHAKQTFVMLKASPRSFVERARFPHQRRLSFRQRRARSKHGARTRPACGDQRLRDPDAASGDRRIAVDRPVRWSHGSASAGRGRLAAEAGAARSPRWHAQTRSNCRPCARSTSAPSRRTGSRCEFQPDPDRSTIEDTILELPVNNPHIKTELPGPKGKAMIARDAEVISPSYPRDYPFVMSHGRGCEVWDVDGNRFLDFAAGIAVCATGHAHPKVVEAVQEAAGEFLHISSDYWHEGMVGLGERLAQHAPMGEPVLSFICQSGTEAVEGAIKLARYVTGRPRFIGFLGGFHGRTMGSLSFTSSKYTQQKGFAPTMPGVTHVPYPNPYRPLFAGNDQGKAVLDYIRMLFERNVPASEVAAILVEPIQGEGGYVVPPDGFLAGLRELCDEHGILLIFDEVQSGVGRTGKMFACEHWGVKPDIMTAAPRASARACRSARSSRRSG